MSQLNFIHRENEVANLARKFGSDDDFDLPTHVPASAPPQQAPQGPLQQAGEVGPAAQQPAPKTPKQPPREVWRVAHGPWGDKKTYPAPGREREYSRLRGRGTRRRRTSPTS